MGILKKFYKNHAFLIILLLLVVLLTFSINIFVQRNIVILSGEFLFSYDYIGHVKNLVENKLLNQEEFFRISQCVDCPTFYNYSAWSSLWVVLLLSLGQIVGLHPFVYFIFIMVVIEIVFLYVFAKLLFGKFNMYAFIIASLFFIFNPHMVYQMPSATQDGVIFGILMGIIALWIFLLTHLSTITKKKLIWFSLSLGILLSFCLNIGISHFPLIFYTLIGIGLYFFTTIKNYSEKFFLIILINVFIVFLSNFPIILSQIISGDTHYLTSFNAMTFIDGLTAGYHTAGLDRKLILLFFGMVIWLLCITKIKLRQKMWLLIFYLILVFIMAGGQIGNLSIYEFIFNHLPFMEHMRSLHRFIFYQIIILFIIIYLGLTRLLQDKRKINNIIGITIGIIFLLINCIYIIENENRFHSGKIPHEYFLVDSYLKNKTEKKVYFPFGPLGNESLSSNYNWLPEQKYIIPTLYSNPFTSIFMLQNILSVEDYQISTPQEAQLRSLVNMTDLKGSINSLTYLGVKYLIVDHNYLWNKNFPEVNIGDISQHAKLDKKFGNIDIYLLENKQKACKPAYGDFLAGYCYNQTNPQYLINKTVQDFVLDRLHLAHQYELTKSKGVRIGDLIVNPATRAKVIEEKILIPFIIYQADNMVKNIYNKTLQKGDYTLFIPVLTLSPADKLFQNERMEVRINDKIIKTIILYGARHGITWEKITLNIPDTSTLSINTNGQGLMIFGNPLLFTSKDMRMLNKKINEYSYLREINTYGSVDNNLNIQVNNYDVEKNALYADNIEVDLLSEKNIAAIRPEQFKENQERINGFPTFTTQQTKNILETILTSNKSISQLDFTIETAYLDSEDLGRLLIFNEYNQIVYQTSIFQKDTPLVRLVIPKNVLQSLSQLIKVQLVIDKKGVLLSEYTIHAKF